MKFENVVLCVFFIKYLILTMVFENLFEVC